MNTMTDKTSLKAAFAQAFDLTSQHGPHHEPGLEWAFVKFADGKDYGYTEASQTAPMAGTVRGVVSGYSPKGYILLQCNHTYVFDDRREYPIETLYFCDNLEIAAFVGSLVEIKFHCGTQSDGKTPQQIYYVDQITDLSSGDKLRIFDSEADVADLGGLFSGAPVETAHPKPKSDQTNQERAQVTAGPLFEERQMDLADYL